MASIEEAKKQLYTRKHEIEQREANGHDDGRNNELSTFDNHPADSADIFYEASKDDALSMHRRFEYDEILHAIEKVEAGTYGICEQTGKPIPVERLIANPAARTVLRSSNESDPSHAHLFLGTPPGNPSPYTGNEVASDGIDMWEALMNTTDDESYHETGTTDNWVEKDPGFTEDIERYASTGIDGFQGAEHVHVNKPPGKDFLNETWR